MRPRFHLPVIDATGYGGLSEEETVHLTRVLRLGVGAAIDVFDGRGHMFEARVVELAHRAARVQVVGPAACAPEPLVRVTLVASVLKGDKMDEVVRDVVMAGAVRLQPVVAARSEVSLAALDRSHRVERWQRVAVSAVKQCGRAVVPEVRPAQDLLAWVKAPGPAPVLVLQEPSAGEAPGLRGTVRADEVQLLVGPEGGWAPQEREEFARAGFRLVSFGGRTLRAEAAPLVAMAAVFEAWGGW